MSRFSGFSRLSTVPAGSLAKASLVGAKTVNGPGPSRVSTRPAAFTAATSVVWSCELSAFSTIFFVGNMAAPPTIGSSWAKALEAEVASATANNRARIFFMILVSFQAKCLGAVWLEAADLASRPSREGRPDGCTPHQWKSDCAKQKYFRGVEPLHA